MAGFDWVRSGEFSAALAAVLRGARRDAGMTLRTVQRLSGGYFRPSAVNGYERGHRQISVDRLCHIAELYGTTGDELLRRTLASLGRTEPEEKPPEAGSRSATLRVFYQRIVEDGDLSAIDELCTGTFTDHEIPGRLQLPHNANGFRTWMRLFHRTFENVTIDVEDMMVVGDQAVVRIHLSLTPRQGGARQGQATRISVAISEWMRFSGERLSERWGIDGTWLLDQAGISAGSERA
ncbi:MAG TPA: ester cyclase [Actinomycetota bacterium]|nr:ester cyclase [Actinomycetota bacterium]